MIFLFFSTKNQCEFQYLFVFESQNPDTGFNKCLLTLHSLNEPIHSKKIQTFKQLCGLKFLEDENTTKKLLDFNIDTQGQTDFHRNNPSFDVV